MTTANDPNVFFFVIFTLTEKELNINPDKEAVQLQKKSIFLLELTYIFCIFSFPHPRLSISDSPVCTPGLSMLAYFASKFILDTHLPALLFSTILWTLERTILDILDSHSSAPSDTLLDSSSSISLLSIFPI